METNDLAKTLRRELEGWREIIIRVHSALSWEKQYHPAVVLGTTNLIFLILHITAPSILTLISVLGIIFVISDYLIPQVSQWAFGIDNWTGADEKKYEQSILAIQEFFDNISETKNCILNLKRSQPKGFFIKTVCFLGCLAWIGTWMNTFLYVLIANFIVSYPGLKREKKFRQIMSQITSKIFPLQKSASGSLKKE